MCASFQRVPSIRGLSHAFVFLFLSTSFSKRCCFFIPFLDPESPDHNLENVRKRSQLLFWAIIAVGAREAEELAATHEFALRRAIHAWRLTLGGRPPSFADCQGFASHSLGLVILYIW
jgi:hypothetical protein